MESLGSYIRSAAQATYSAYRTVPVRWRLLDGGRRATFTLGRYDHRRALVIDPYLDLTMYAGGTGNV